MQQRAAVDDEIASVLNAVDWDAVPASHSIPDLEAPVSEDEIRKAMRRCKRHKTPVQSASRMTGVGTAKISSRRSCYASLACGFRRAWCLPPSAKHT